MYQNIMQMLQQLFSGQQGGGGATGRPVTPGAMPGGGARPMPMPVIPGNQPPNVLGGTPSFIDSLLPGTNGGSPPMTGGDLPPYNGPGRGFEGRPAGNIAGGPQWGNDDPQVGFAAAPGNGVSAMPVSPGTPGAIKPMPLPSPGGQPRARDPGFSLQPGQMPGMRQPQQPRIGNPGGGMGNGSGFTNALPRRVTGGY